MGHGFGVFLQEAEIFLFLFSLQFLFSEAKKFLATISIFGSRRILVSHYNFYFQKKKNTIIVSRYKKNGACIDQIPFG